MPERTMPDGSIRYFDDFEGGKAPDDATRSRVLKEAMPLLRPAGQGQVASPAPTTTPAAPASTPVTVDDDGTRRMRFGVYERTTDANGGNVRWANTETGQEEMPASMRQAERGGLSDDEDYSLWRQQRQFDRLSLEQKQRRRAAHDYASTDIVARAAGVLNGGGGELKRGGDGKYYRTVVFNADEEGPVKDTNDMFARMGRKSRMKNIGVSIQTDENGVPVKGARARAFIGLSPTGGVEANGATHVKELDDIGDVMTRWAKAYGQMRGVSKEEAERKAYERFGGAQSVFGDNPAAFNLAPTDREKFGEEQRKFDATQDMAGRKLSLADQQFYAGLGMKSKELAETARQFDANFGLNERKYEEAKREFDESLSQQQKQEADKLGVRRMEILANAGASLAKGGGTRDLLAALPREFVKSYIDAEIPVLDADGNQVMDEMTGQPSFRKPTTEEMRSRFNELKSLAEQAYGAANGSGYLDRLATVLDGDGDSASQPQATPAATEQPQQGGLPAYDPAKEDQYRPGDRFTNEGAIWEVGADGRAHFISRIGDAQQPQATSTATDIQPQVAETPTTEQPQAQVVESQSTPAHTESAEGNANEPPVLAPAAEMAAMAQPPARNRSPLSQTRLRDIPGAILDRTVDAVNRLDEAVDDRVRQARAGMGRAAIKAVDMANSVVNATPSDVARRAQSLAQGARSSAADTARRTVDAARQARDDARGKILDAKGKAENQVMQTVSDVEQGVENAVKDARRRLEEAIPSGDEVRGMALDAKGKAENRIRQAVSDVEASIKSIAKKASRRLRKALPSKGKDDEDKK